MELKTTNIHLPSWSKDAVIMPIGDIQYTGKSGSTARRLLKEFVQKGLDNNAYFLGMGDYIDPMSPSNRSRYAAANLYDTARKFVDEAAHNLTTELYEDVLKPTKGRWLGLLEGHHFHQFEAGHTTDMELARLLEAPFLGTSAYVRLLLRGGKQSTRVAFTIWCHHGAGGGQSAGSPLLKLERMANNWDADLFAIGHQSKLVSAPIERVYPVWQGPAGPQLHHRKMLLVGTGSFSRAYMVGSKQGQVPRGDYVEQRMLTPTHLGGVVIRLGAREVAVNNKRSMEKRLTVEL